MSFCTCTERQSLAFRQAQRQWASERRGRIWLMIEAKMIYSMLQTIFSFASNTLPGISSKLATSLHPADFDNCSDWMQIFSKYWPDENEASSVSNWKNHYKSNSFLTIQLVFAQYCPNLWRQLAECPTSWQRVHASIKWNFTCVFAASSFSSKLALKWPIPRSAGTAWMRRNGRMLCTGIWFDALGCPV